MGNEQKGANFKLCANWAYYCKALLTAVLEIEIIKLRGFVSIKSFCKLRSSTLHNSRCFLQRFFLKFQITLLLCEMSKRHYFFVQKQCKMIQILYFVQSSKDCITGEVLFLFLQKPFETECTLFVPHKIYVLYSDLEKPTL